MFRVWLADQLPKPAKLGANSVNDWRRTLTMMYEGPLLRSEEFQSGTRGEGFNLFIMEFKKLKREEYTSGFIASRCQIGTNWKNQG